MDPTSQRELKILTQIAEKGDVTQRGLSKSLGIALGLTNLYLKRLARKGYIKVTTIPSNRVKYLLTPRGLSQKTRLTYEYMRFSLYLYGQTRRTLRQALAPLIAEDHKRFALYGTGEAAELAYLTLKELGLDPIAVYADDRSTTFLGLPVRPLIDLTDAPIDRLIVVSFDGTSDRRLAEVAKLVPDEKLIVIGPRRGL